MPRLGDLLVQAGRVTPAQVEDAARAQVAYGGRLGTNLVELGHLEIDEVAVFLGRQHRMAPVQRPHFEHADGALQVQLPAAVAGRLGVVPIARTVSDHAKIAIACLGPLPPEAVLEIALALGCAPADLVFAVGAELRILYNLERVYGIARPSRFLRTRRGGTREITIAPVDDDASDDELAIPVAVEDTATVPVASEDEILELAPDDDVLEAEPAPAERRRFVRTIADYEPEPTPTHERIGTTSLGRIELRKVAIAPAIEGSIVSGATTQECLRLLRRSRDRDQIGVLAVDCLDRQSGDALDAGVLFIARGPVAVGWNGFSRGAVVDFEQLAVPLDQPSVVARPPGTVVRRIAPGHGPIEPLDERLIAALSFDQPSFVVAAPIAIRDHVLGFVYGQGRGNGDAAEELIVAIADAARAALTSLLRAAQR
jgi:hypothetical protein